MNKATILVSAVLGIFLGTSIGIAQASSAPVTTSSAVEFEVTAEVTENIFFTKEVTIVGNRPALRATSSVPSKPATKVLVCTPFKDLEQGYGQVKTCEWK